ncbi:peptide-methionine (S)-S-oxide reductase MsrA [Gynuella sunshinyii]|uniref:Peptide methionine sulfoxide reductase MsrA n=1 Tax=Gynuella sunshinyii YC6258 TaxID=1445510 RepID=A0A0C5VH86_9GAMM|nr:peptide-methionine (S)-S-oxide reductase MsrA [Gynuella sunshinyii]AJQ93606.1 peptide methionine sulfoxide reductase [Gynuella sunshinyii YC6258]
MASLTTFPEQYLAGRDTPIEIEKQHFVTGRSIVPPWPEGSDRILLGMGCFWGAERKMWQQPGVITTAAGYAGGETPNPTYDEVCTGLTGHSEVVLVVFDPRETNLQQLLKVFWESHDPTQGMRQGNDIGTQYRSAIYCCNHSQCEAVLKTREQFQQQLTAKGLGEITTEIKTAPVFYYAETYHQQYLAKNPDGYCGLKGTGVTCVL